MKKPVLVNSMAATLIVLAFLAGIYFNGLPLLAADKSSNQVGQKDKTEKTEKIDQRSSLETSAVLADATEEEAKTPVQYRVKAGDSLYTLAERYDTSINSIMYMNKLTTDKLAIDQELRIPRQKLALPKDYHPLEMAKADDSQSIPATVKTTKQQPSAKPVVAKVALATVSRGTVSTGAQLIEWSKVNPLFAPGVVATVTDVDTGLTFKVKRNRGHNHADVDPLTAQDTATMKKIYGGQWSWARRAIIVELKGQRIAASMNGMPHGEPIVKDNNFPGHFCIHFLGSMTHGSEYTKSHKPQVDPDHQAMVHKAAGK